MRRYQALEYCFVAIVCLLRVISGPTADLSYFLIAGYAFTGRAQVVKALALSWLFTMISPGIAAESSFATVGRFIIIAAAVASVLVRIRCIPQGASIRKPVFGTILLGAFFVVHACLVSPFLSVSILKTISWILVVTALLSAWLNLTDRARARLTNELFGGLALIMLLSLPLIVHPLGYLRNGSGFQGVLNHPQVFGPTMALLGAWAASQLLATRRPAWPVVMLAAVCPALIIFSEARTAGLALVLGVAIAVIAVSVLSGRRITAMAPGLKSRRFLVVATIGLGGSILLGPSIASYVGQYLSKGSQVGTLTEAYYGSRGRLIEKMWVNIEEHPVEGIGFGVASDPSSMTIERDPVLGLPIGASIEKGVMPLAVLEELGIGGFFLVACWVFVLLRRAAQTSVSNSAIACTAIFLNMGESTLFSPGGFGLLIIVLLTWAATGSSQKSVVTS